LTIRGFSSIFSEFLLVAKISSNSAVALAVQHVHINFKNLRGRQPTRQTRLIWVNDAAAPHAQARKPHSGVVFELDVATKLLPEQPRTNQNNRKKVLVTVRFLVVRNCRRSCSNIDGNPKSSPVTLSGSHDCKANRRGGKGAAPAARIVLVPESPCSRSA